MTNSNYEIMGQTEFFKELRLEDDVIFTDHTDGVVYGTLFEFKYKIENYNEVLSQAIKYLSRMRITGKNIPANILLIALNEEKAYYFKSNDFLDKIEIGYSGPASKNNKNLSNNIKPEVINFSKRNGFNRINEIIENKTFIKIHIDDNCVIGWAERYYNENPRETKKDFFEELRTPKHFKQFIYAWTGQETDFQYIMDCLNDKIHKKELGAFYTPPEYAKISAEMVHKAVVEIPSKNDYIILDRCAGTGNLEEFLTNEELSHTIVATYELKEWQVLNYRLGDKVRFIIPPVKEEYGRPLLEKEDLFSKENPNINGLLQGGDALAVDVFEEVKQYVNNPKCNIIMLENPPYSDEQADYIKKGKSRDNNNFVRTQYMLDRNGDKSSFKDLSNLFIWSSWKYYLTKPDDQYILYSPVKYWKSLGLSNKKYMEGYLFNRKYFHAGASAISCIRWKNIEENLEQIELKPFDITIVGGKERTVSFDSNIVVKKVYKTFADNFYDTRDFEDDKISVCCESTGYEAPSKKWVVKGKLNNNIIGFLRTGSFAVDPKNVTLLRVSYYTYKGGFYLRNDNYITKLPLFCAKLYPQENWYEKDIYFTTSDKGEEYIKDKQLLKSCLIYACLSQQNKCISFIGSDNHFYKNELCFDNNTQASKDIRNMKLNKSDHVLLEKWNDILNEAKKTTNYNHKYTYGLWQIIQELNTYIGEDGEVYTIEKLKEKKKLYKARNKEFKANIQYINLNTYIEDLKALLKNYYKEEIQDKLFKYELLK